MVSIIVPIYNVECYLEKCLESIIRQTYKDIEIILVDDGSRDSSGIIAESFERKDKRVIFLQKENGGLSDARNYGLDHAKGDYVSFVDSDDWIDETMIEKMMSKAQETCADIVCCDMAYVDDEGNHRFSSGGEFETCHIIDHPEMLSINNSACNKLYKRDLFENVRFPKGLWYEDIGTIPKLIFLSNIIAKVDEPLYFYYQRSGSISHTKNEKVFDIYACLEDVYSFIDTRTNDVRFLREINKMLIIDGVELTTLRIKDYSEDREIFLKKNMDLIERIYPNWYDDSLLREYPWKKRLMFYFLKKRYFKTLLRCFR